jgi:serine/threonine-protein kinase
MLKKVSLAGGPPVAITTARSQILGIDDLPSGDFLFGDHSSGIFRVPSSGGDAVAVVEIDQTGPQRFPVVLPGDRGLLFTVGGVPVSNRIAVLPSGATAPRFLTNGTDARYLPTGHIVFWRDGSLFAAPFDLSRLEIGGDAVPVVERVQVRGTGAAAFTWSPDGTLAYMQDVKPPDRRLVWVDRQGAETPLEAPPGPYAAPRLAPDDSKRTGASCENDGEVRTDIIS